MFRFGFNLMTRSAYHPPPCAGSRPTIESAPDYVALASNGLGLASTATWASSLAGVDRVAVRYRRATASLRLRVSRRPPRALRRASAFARPGKPAPGGRRSRHPNAGSADWCAAAPATPRAGHGKAVVVRLLRARGPELTLPGKAISCAGRSRVVTGREVGTDRSHKQRCPSHHRAPPFHRDCSTCPRPTR